MTSNIHENHNAVAECRLYFSGFGLILREFGVSLKTYFTSASIMGLAIGFGLQGFVQDIVMGLTLVFSNIVDVGDMVEISGQTGLVRKVGMRFTVLENPLGAIVYLPNRTIVNVLHYPRGYLSGLGDITLPSDRALAQDMQQRVAGHVASLFDQFPGICVTRPSIEGRVQTQSGKAFLRIKFRIWPGRGGPIETVFKQELVQALKGLDEKYEDWMIAVNYEVEQKASAVSSGNFRRPHLSDYHQH